MHDNQPNISLRYPTDCRFVVTRRPWYVNKSEQEIRTEVKTVDMAVDSYSSLSLCFEIIDHKHEQECGLPYLIRFLFEFLITTLVRWD